MAYCSAIKINEILIYATIWVNLENTVSEISQRQNNKYYMAQLYVVPRIVKFVKKVEKRLPGAGGREEWRVNV